MRAGGKANAIAREGRGFRDNAEWSTPRGYASRAIKAGTRSAGDLFRGRSGTSRRWDASARL